MLLSVPKPHRLVLTRRRQSTILDFSQRINLKIIFTYINYHGQYVLRKPLTFLPFGNADINIESFYPRQVIEPDGMEIKQILELLFNVLDYFILNSFEFLYIQFGDFEHFLFDI
jgi:hypothetical protein